MLVFLVVAGGILLAMLVTVSTIVDNRFRAIHQGGSIGFTSMLIIVRLPSSSFVSPSFLFLKFDQSERLFISALHYLPWIITL